MSKPDHRPLHWRPPRDSPSSRQTSLRPGVVRKDSLYYPINFLFFAATAGLAVHCGRRSLRPGARHGLGPREHALPAPEGNENAAVQDVQSANGMNDATQPQHFTLRTGSSTSGSPASSRASSQSGFRVQSNTPRFSWGLSPAPVPELAGELQLRTPEPASAQL